MACKHPLKAFPIGKHDTGSTKYKITSYDIDYVWRNKSDEIWYSAKGEPYNTRYSEFVSNFIEIPCGKCISCRLQYSRDWANRCMLESFDHESSYFVTLTYDNDHIPDCNPCVDSDTGEVIESPVHPLNKRDVQLFMKRLRKHFPDQKIRFYGCGEYGAENMRPHYHLILFGLQLDDLQPLTKNALGQQIYISETISKLWKNGIISVGPVTWETCAYTARYVTKKLSGPDSEIYEKYNFPREFSLCSRKPGIARKYYDDHKKEIYDTDEIFISRGIDRSIKAKPPKYFDKLFDIDYPEDSIIIKEKRREIAESNNKLKMSTTSLGYLEQLEAEENNLLARTRALKRNL